MVSKTLQSAVWLHRARILQNHPAGDRRREAHSYEHTCAFGMCTHCKCRGGCASQSLTFASMKLCSSPSAQLPTLKEGRTGEMLDVCSAPAVDVSQRSLCPLGGLGAIECTL